MVLEPGVPRLCRLERAPRVRPRGLRVFSLGRDQGLERVPPEVLKREGRPSRMGAEHVQRPVVVRAEATRDDQTRQLEIRPRQDVRELPLARERRFVRRDGVVEPPECDERAGSRDVRLRIRPPFQRQGEVLVEEPERGGRVRVLEARCLDE
jgi:hypothetical protein